MGCQFPYFLKLFALAPPFLQLPSYEDEYNQASAVFREQLNVQNGSEKFCFAHNFLRMWS